MELRGSEPVHSDEGQRALDNTRNEAVSLPEGKYLNYIKKQLSTTSVEPINRQFLIMILFF